MKKNLLVNLQKGVLMLAAALLFFGCGQVETFDAPDLSEAQEKFRVVMKTESSNGEWARTVYDFCGVEKETTLIAGQKIEVGKVTVYNSEDMLYVTITTDGPWYIRKTHLYVGERDQTEGIKNPAPGRFPYAYDASSVNNYGVQEYTYEIDAEGLEGWGEFDVAVHADVVRVDVDEDGFPMLDGNQDATILQKEGAWGEGSRFTLKGNWAMYFTYTLQECSEDICTGTWFRMASRNNAGEGLEDFDFTESEESEEYELFDGPTLVGKVTFQRNNPGGPPTSSSNFTLNVKFEITEEGYSFEEYGVRFNTSANPSSINRDFFLPDAIFINPDGETKTFNYSALNNHTYYVQLYANISGVCKVN